MQFNFDMDGTLCDLYGVENWLSCLESLDPTPYEIAKPLLNFSLLARYINKLQTQGHTFCIVSWTSKKGTAEFNAKVTEIKIAYLQKHLPSVHWDMLRIIPYGTDKYSVCGGGVLFDDEERNRKNWKEQAYMPSEILVVLKNAMV